MPCFPFSSWMTLPTALSVPEARMMFWASPQPSYYSFPEGPSGSSGGSDGMVYGHKSLSHAQVVMGDLGQGSQAVGARGIADNIEEVIFHGSYPSQIRGLLVLNVLFEPLLGGYSSIYATGSILNDSAECILNLTQQILIEPVSAKEPYPTQVKLFYYITGLVVLHGFFSTCHERITETLPQIVGGGMDGCKFLLIASTSSVTDSFRDLN